jgi:DNA polymerase-3 subunit alpha
LNAVSNGEAIGLLKFDFLGLRNLTILEKALSYVEQTRGEKIELSKISLEDKATYELISSGTTIGVFQLESRGMQHLAKDIKPNQFSDISAMVALFRPGPMALIPQFIEGKKNPKKIKYLHKSLEPILAETYGILVYQEQVTEIAHKIAGFTMSEADLLRMAMGKKKKELMKKGKVTFIKGCVKYGYTEKLAEQLFEFIEKFAAYGFNKAHSASYATIAYWTGFVKAHYPVEFMTALLTAEIEHATGAAREEKIVQILEECKRMKIEVLPPDVNLSSGDFKIEGAAIRFGLSAIKNVGAAATENIFAVRAQKPFVSLTDFLHRVDLRVVNKRTVEGFIYSGAFDDFGSRAQLLALYNLSIKEIQKMKLKADEGQFGLFAQSDVTEDTPLKDNLPQVAEFSEDMKIELERQAIGFYLSANPLARYEAVFKRKKAVPVIELGEHKSKTVVVGGMIKSVKKINTKKSGEEMLFVTLSDNREEVELVVFPKVYLKTRSIWVSNNIILAKGKVQERDDELALIVDLAVSLKMYDKN